VNDALQTEMPATDPYGETSRTVDDQPRVRAWAALPVGLGSAIVGLVPWWVGGARLELQNLWATSVLPAQMPITLLPFSQYSVIQIFALLVVGATVAGIAGRALRLRGWGLVLLVLGVLLVQGVAAAQTALVVREGLQERLESTVYVAALLAGTILSIIVGMILTVLIVRAPRAGALLGLTVGAICMAPWTGALVAATGIDENSLSTLLVVVPWITPVLTGVAIAWTGVNTVGRVISGILAIALVWVAPALMTAIASALGSRVLIRFPADMLDYGNGVFRMALLTPELALRPIIATVVVAVVGLVIRMLVLRRRRGA